MKNDKKEIVSFRLSETTKNTFNLIRENENLTQDELLIKMINHYMNNNESLNKEENSSTEIKINLIYEYLTLLVKTNPSLPQNETEMSRMVNLKSRFEKPILEKIQNEQN